MEAIGAGASTLAFVLLALKSAKIINESLSSIRDAPRIVLELVQDVEFLQSVLGRISSDSLRHAPTSKIESLNDVPRACTTELSSIECRLAKFSGSKISSRSSRMYKGVLAYVKKEDLENARGRIRDKSTQINLYLGLLQAQSLLEVSSRIDTQATTTTTILEQILGEVSKLHKRLNQDAVPGETEQHTEINRDGDAIDSIITSQLGTMKLCSELESSISRLSTLVDHDGLTLDAEDAEQIIDDLRRFVVVAKERSAGNSNQDKGSVAYNTGTENDAKVLGRDLKLIEGLILSAPIIAINQSVPGSRKLRSHLPRGTVIKQKRIREEIDVDHGYLTYAATASVEMCKFLIESGADVDEMGEHTGTALSRIAGLDRHDTTLVLLENMADPTLSYPGWDNPLSTACNLDLPSAELFLKHGGYFAMHDLESFDLNGRTRLHQVCMAETRSTSKQKAIAMLAAAGADLKARMAKSWSPDDHQTLGFTCLHSLVYQANRSKDRDELEALIFLIHQGADIFAVDHHQHSVAMQTGGVDDYWKQPVRRCDHVACSDCEELPPQTDEHGTEPKGDADVPVYAQPIYREWMLARSPESNPTHFPYIDHISPVYDEFDGYNEGNSQPTNYGYEYGHPEYGESEALDSDGGGRLYDEMKYQAMSELSPPSSEDGEAAYERLVAPYELEEPDIGDYPAFVDRWLEHYIQAAEEEDEETMN
ncbi:hypothetical protein IL306_014721 [Fusarium sp. DS 682]|nr:hypothetical protein IL306_014721 [Fusarium sp. DS 682]